MSPLDTLAPGCWLEVPDSHLRPHKAPTPPGITEAACGNFRHIMGAWNSGAFDTLRNRLLVWGGGHAAWGGNEWYAFDLVTLTWSRLNDPSSFVGFTQGDRVMPDGTAPTAHTYDGLAYLPNVDKVFVGGSSVFPGSGLVGHAWLFDLASLTWEQIIDVPREGLATAYDPVGGLLYTHSTKKPNPVVNGFWSYDPTSDGWSLRYSPPWGTWWPSDAVSVIDPVRRKYVSLHKGGALPRIADLSAIVKPMPNLLLAGDLEILDATAPGLVHDPVRDRLVAWSGAADVYVIDLDALTVIRRPPAPENTVIPSAAAPNGTYGRFQYVPGLDVFVAVNHVDENVFIYRPPETW